jgi:hypothetical protein
MERAGESFRPGRALRPGGARRRQSLSALTLVVVLVALASLFAYAKTLRTGRGQYELADDCPRGALVYAQVSDFPALLRLWDGSELKERYLAGTNFEQFANGHVALKLLARAQEFGDALGFALDAEALAGAAENKAAVAVYDIGRMEFVFVAPASEEKALAARFFQGKDNFDETELPDGTVYYGRDVEADRGRQKQKILFAFARGRFVLATSEQLMLRALANVNGRSRHDRLSDEPSFKTLSGEVVPHFAAVWVDQTRLNGDYYFKHYWVMGGGAALKGIRAGLFDFEMREGSWAEHREFLTEGGKGRAAALSAQDVRELSAALPAAAAYARLRALAGEPGEASSLVRNTLLDRAQEESAGGGRGRRLHEEFDPAYEGREDYGGGGDYTCLGSDYDEAIDDPSDAGEGEASGKKVNPDDGALAALERVLAQARPVQSASAESPVMRDGPLFAEFRRLAVLRLDSPGALDRRALEDAMSSLVAGRLTVEAAGAGLSWSDAGEGARGRRELELPMLGWKLCYALKGRELFVSNDAGFLDAALAGEGEKQRRRTDALFTPDDVTLIRSDRRAEAFDGVFRMLDAGSVSEYWARRGQEATQGSEEFFSGNVASLLDAASPVGRVEIARRSTPGRLREEVELFMSGDGAEAPAR